MKIYEVTDQDSGKVTIQEAPSAERAVALVFRTRPGFRADWIETNQMTDDSYNVRDEQGGLGDFTAVLL